MGFLGWIVPSEGRYAGIMKNLKIVSRWMVVLGLLVASLSAFAEDAAVSNFPNVIASPAYQNLGSASRGQTLSTTVQFLNESTTTIPFFNVYCSGDLSAFSCASTCGYLPAFGSCTVFVRFMPYNGDGLTRSVYLNGYGSGAFATATVMATEAKTP